jgi:Kyakuja-Dileera-Zisupton transposase
MFLFMQLQSDNALQRESNDDNWMDDTVGTEAGGTFTCVNRWRNAGPETRKKMFSVFDESGIFIAACRHRFVLLACDMIRSGELLSYFSIHLCCY